MTTPIVCLPGFAGLQRLMEPLAEALAPGAMALALPEGGPREAAEQLSQALPVDKVHIVAASYGGLVASWLPAERVASLVLIGTAPDREAAGFSAVHRAFLHLPDSVAEALYRHHLRRELRREGVEDIESWVASCPSPASLRRRILGIASWEVAPWPAVPTLWLAGLEDDQSDWTDDRVRSGLGAVDVIRVPGRHRPHLTGACGLARVLVSWWTGLAESAEPRGAT